MTANREVTLTLLKNMFSDQNVGASCIDLLRRTAIRLCDQEFKYIGSPYWFTDHGPIHSDSVLYNAIELARYLERFAGRLSDQDIIGLASACYLHDIGMAHIPSYHKLKNGWTTDFVNAVRAWHVSAVDELLPKFKSDLGELYNRFPILEEGIRLVCKAHGTKNHLPVCDEFRKTQLPNFKGELLGKILLLSDELHLDHRRAILDHPQAAEFPPEAKAHQYKHHYVLDVVIRAPSVEIHFGFPDDLEPEKQETFIEWTCGKLKKQIELVKKNLPNELAEAFDLVPRAMPRKPLAGRKVLPADAWNAAKKLAKSVREKKSKHSDLRDRPNRFDPRRTKPREQGDLYPVMDRLMDELFREIETQLALKFYDKLYVPIDSNKKVLDELLFRASKFRRKFKRRKHGQRLGSDHVFIITGRTGCGKSAFINHIKLEHQLSTQLPEKGEEGLFIIFIDCLRLGRLEEVIREMLIGLAEECQRSKLVWSSLKSEGWAAQFQAPRISTMPKYTLLSVFKALMKHLHLKRSRDLHMVVPVVFVLDNVDRMMDFGLKKDIVEFAHAERRKGYPFFVITLRNTTKRMIDKMNNDIAALPTHEVRAPSHTNLLSARLDAAFSMGVLKNAESWCQPQEVEAMLDDRNLKFHDLRGTLQFAMQTLTLEREDSPVAFIPGMSGTNMRISLTLYRAIMKSIDVKELFELSLHKVTGGHYLIKAAALERFPCYFASRSKIQNIFDPSISEFYFIKIYLLKIFERLSGGGEYLPLKKLVEGATQIGLPEKLVKDEMWSMLAEEYAYVELEGFEDGLPQERYHYVDDLPRRCRIRISSGGQYYLRWLIADISYLDCIMQDTLMDTMLAQKLADMRTHSPSGLPGVFARVYKFLNYLKEQEIVERASFGGCDSIRQVIEEVVERVELQEKALIR